MTVVYCHRLALLLIRFFLKSEVFPGSRSFARELLQVWALCLNTHFYKKPGQFLTSCVVKRTSSAFHPTSKSICKGMFPSNQITIESISQSHSRRQKQLRLQRPIEGGVAAAIWQLRGGDENAKIVVNLRRPPVFCFKPTFPP